MAYELPDADDLISRFPEFSDATDVQLSPFIQAAAMWVDDSWFESDYQMAVIYLAAHYYSLYKRALAASATSGGGGGGGGGGDVQTFLSMIKFEDFQVQFGNAGKSTTTSTTGGTSSGSATTLAMTSYGALFAELRDRNVVPVTII
jgi:hypothetical protein